MTQKEMDLFKQIFELTASIGEMRGKIDTLEKENEFLRELLKDRLNKEEQGGMSEKPTVEQVAWVLEKISEHMNDGGGTYRYLIYDRMGFDESAYVTLQQAGGLAISNMIDEWLDMKEGQGK